jgi:hypothetical protein
VFRKALKMASKTSKGLGKDDRNNFKFNHDAAMKQAILETGWAKGYLLKALYCSATNISGEYSPAGKLREVFDKTDPADIKYLISLEQMFLRGFYTRIAPPEVVDDPRKLTPSVRSMMRCDAQRFIEMAVLIQKPVGILELLFEQYPPAQAYLYTDVSCFSYSVQVRLLTQFHFWLLSNYCFEKCSPGRSCSLSLFSSLYDIFEIFSTP